MNQEENSSYVWKQFPYISPEIAFVYGYNTAIIEAIRSISSISLLTERNRQKVIEKLVSLKPSTPDFNTGL